MCLRTFLSITVFVLAGSGPATAQSTAPDTLRVGDVRVDGSIIEAFQVTWRALRRNADGSTRASNQVEEIVAVLEADEGEDLLKFTQTWKDSLGGIVFVSVRVAERRSMAYRAFHTGRAPNGLGHLDIDGASVHGFYSPSPEQPLHEFSLTLAETPFASFAGLLFAALPHEAGHTAVLPGFGWGGTTNPTLVWQEFRIVERERVELPGNESVDAWRIETSRSPGSQLIYWVTKEAPYFVRAESHSASGTSAVYEVESWGLLPAPGR